LGVEVLVVEGSEIEVMELLVVEAVREE